MAGRFGGGGSWMLRSFSIRYSDFTPVCFYQGEVVAS